MTTKVEAKDINDVAFLTAGTAPNYTVTIPREWAYADMDRQKFTINFHASASSAVTININGLWAKNLKDANWNTIISINADAYASIIYDLSADSFIVEWSSWSIWLNVIVAWNVAPAAPALPNPDFLHFADETDYDTEDGTTTWHKIVETQINITWEILSYYYLKTNWTGSNTFKVEAQLYVNGLARWQVAEVDWMWGSTPREIAVSDTILVSAWDIISIRARNLTSATRWWTITFFRNYVYWVIKPAIFPLNT